MCLDCKAFWFTKGAVTMEVGIFSSSTMTVSLFEFFMLVQMVNLGMK